MGWGNVGWSRDGVGVGVGVGAKVFQATVITCVTRLFFGTRDGVCVEESEAAEGSGLRCGGQHTEHHGRNLDLYFHPQKKRKGTMVVAFVT